MSYKEEKSIYLKIEDEMIRLTNEINHLKMELETARLVNKELKQKLNALHGKRGN